MDELITVVVPVYNVEKYIDDCLKSIVNQTYKNLEIIIVNDGSTDRSFEICKKYEQNDKRITLINEKNSGVSKARNMGMKCATGKYIIFIDSDDWLEKDMIECLYEEIIKNEADISICEFYINNENKQFSNNKLEEIQIIYKKRDMYKFLFEENLFGGYLWNKLIKREIINTNFNEVVAVEEDVLFFIDIFRNAKKIVYHPANRLYHYRRRNNSAVVFQYSKKDVSKLYALEQKIKVQKEFDLPNLVKTEYEYYILARKAKYIIKKENIKDDNIRNKIELISKKYFFKLIKETPFKEKIKICLIAISPYIYCKLSEEVKKWKS